MTWEITIQGIVQGVGFRPFIKGLADRLSILGKVINSSSGVIITINADKSSLDNFIHHIKTYAPILSHITNIEYVEINNQIFHKFTIESSQKAEGITLVSPDTAMCDKCRDEILNKHEHRYLYPFTNCTNCGPRYSITKSIPYDRKNTVMNSFKMCSYCEREYIDVSDRRFHAQPIACNSCGPKIYANILGEKEYNQDIILKKAADYIDKGGIIALKGLGGYHLICDALNDEAVKKLRHLKKRKTKPFALMVENSNIIKSYINLPKEIEDIMKSPASPIVICDWDKNNMPFSKYISPKSSKVGIMQAYTPLHVILFQYLKTDFIVATSGNKKDEPISKDEIEAENNLKDFTDFFIHHNREIYTRIDDSVISLTDFGYTIMRRARGYAPFPVYIKSDNKKPLFSAGANLKSSIALYKDNFAFLSQYIGDLDNIETEEMYKETYLNMKTLFNIETDIGIHDYHSQYRSSIFTKENFSKTKFYQHHVAHFMSCVAENSLEDNAIGIVLDGFGLGIDNSSWGGEVFIKQDNIVTREYNIIETIQPGLDSASKNPCRMAVSYLYKYNLLDKMENYLIDNLIISKKEINLIKMAIDNKINIINTSSAGRFFEAIGSLVLKKSNNEFEGELAILLENTASKNISDKYDFQIIDNKIELQNVFISLSDDLLNGVDIDVISAKLHNGVIHIFADICRILKDKYNIFNVCLSGGCMQNIYLLNGLYKLLSSKGFHVYTHKKVPANDGGISLGQIYCFLKDIKFLS